MRNGSRAGLRISTAFMVLAGYLALYTVTEFGPMALIPPLFLFPLAPIGEWLDRKSVWYKRITGVVSVACLLAVPLWWEMFGLLRAMVLLFIYIQAYEMMHAKTVRSYYHIYLMSFFLLVAACVESPDATIAAVMALFLVSAVWAFFLLEIDRATSGGDAALATPDIVGLGERYATAPPPGPVRFNRGVAGMAAAMSLMTLLMTVLFFVATPRMEAGLFGRERMDDAMITGLSETVDLGQGGTLLGDQTPVMYVTFPEEPEGAYDQEMYWRSHALNMYTGNGWQASDHAAWWEDSGAPAFTTEASSRQRVFRYPFRENGRIVRQQIYMDEVPKSLPVLDLAQRVEVEAAEIAWTRSRDGTIQVLRSARDVLEYEAWSEVAVPDPDLLADAPDNYRDVLDERLYAVYTNHDLLPSTLEIVDDVTANADSPYEKAVALRNYLSSPAFLYTTEIPTLPAENAVDLFIQSVRAGHCQLYASALALMLRSEGIPARIVSGYRGGEFDPNARSYTVRADMAHVWVDVFILGYGWVVFDPSPMADQNETLLGELSRQVSRTILRGKMIWYQSVVGFDSGIRLDRLSELRANLFSNPFAAPAADTAEAGEEERRSSRAAYLGVLGALAGIALFVAFRRRERIPVYRGAGGLTAEQKRAVRVYQLLRRRLHRRGVRPGNMTAGELAEAAREQGLDAAGSVTGVVEAYVMSRFGMRPMSKARFAELAAQIRREYGGRPS